MRRGTGRGTLTVVAPAAALALVLVLAAGCGPAPGGPSAMSPTVPPVVEPGKTVVPSTSPVDGTPIAVTAEGLTKVSGFTILTPEGQVVFTMGVNENGVDFPASHLAEHMATATQVRVWFRAEGDVLVAYRLEDAPAP